MAHWNQWGRSHENRSEGSKVEGEGREGKKSAGEWNRPSYVMCMNEYEQWNPLLHISIMHQ